jgi:hypothetical protein
MEVNANVRIDTVLNAMMLGLPRHEGSLNEETEAAINHAVKIRRQQGAALPIVKAHQTELRGWG